MFAMFPMDGSSSSAAAAAAATSRRSSQKKKQKKQQKKKSSSRESKIGTAPVAAAAAAAAAAGGGGGSGSELGVAHRDEQFSIFHALGKILYGKASIGPRADKLALQMAMATAKRVWQKTNAPTLRTPETIVDCADMTPTRIVDWLHQNFHGYLPQTDGEFDDVMMQTQTKATGLEDISNVLDLLGDADLLADASRSQGYGNSTSAVPEQFASSVASRAYLHTRYAQVRTLAEDAKVALLAIHKASHSNLSGPLSTRMRKVKEQVRHMALQRFSGASDGWFISPITFANSKTVSVTKTRPSRLPVNWSSMGLSLFTELLPFVGIISSTDSKTVSNSSSSSSSSPSTP
jgi:hypothetical protein